MKTAEQRWKDTQAFSRQPTKKNMWNWKCWKDWSVKLKQLLESGIAFEMLLMTQTAYEQQSMDKKVQAAHIEKRFYSLAWSYLTQVNMIKCLRFWSSSFEPNEKNT